MPVARTPSTVKNSAVPITTRRACGSPMACWTWCWVEIACTTKNDTAAEININTNVTAEKTPILAHSTGSRFGTAMKLDRIMPVEYSEVMIMTPSTPIAASARW